MGWMAEEKETPIALPKTTAAITRKRERLDIVVNIASDGKIWINNQRYSIDKLRRVLVEVRRSARETAVTVIIRADGKALHEDVVRVIDACTAAELKNISFVSINARKKRIR